MLTAAIVLVGVESARAQSQTQTFMLVNGGAIPGDSTVLRHRGRQGGIDSAGPRLWAAAVAAQNLGPVQIDIRKAGADPFKFYEILLTNAESRASYRCRISSSSA